MFFNTIEQYILSDGQTHPLIRGVSIDKPPKKNVSDGVLRALCGSYFTQEKEQDQSDVEDEYADDPYTPNGGNVFPDGSKVKPSSYWLNDF
jgi:hypothetical protein